MKFIRYSFALLIVSLISAVIGRIDEAIYILIMAIYLRTIEGE